MKKDFTIYLPDTFITASGHFHNKTLFLDIDIDFFFKASKDSLKTMSKLLEVLYDAGFENDGIWPQYDPYESLDGLILKVKKSSFVETNNIKKR